MAKHIEDLSQFLQNFGVAPRPSLASSLDHSIGAQRYFGIGRQPAFLCLVDAFYCSCFCNQRSRYREWARLFLGGAGKRRCASTDDGIE